MSGLRLGQASHIETIRVKGKHFISVDKFYYQGRMSPFVVVLNKLDASTKDEQSPTGPFTTIFAQALGA